MAAKIAATTITMAPRRQWRPFIYLEKECDRLSAHNLLYPASAINCKLAKNKIYPVRYGTFCVTFRLGNKA